MRKSSVLITAPATEPVTLAEVKAWLRIDTTDEDTILTPLIAGARQVAEKFLRTALITQTWEYTLDLTAQNIDIGEGFYDLPITEVYGYFPRVIELPYQPVQSITHVKYYDLDNTLTTFDSANYTLDVAGSRFLLDRDATYPTMRPNASIVIRYVAGYGTASDVPYAIKIAIMGYIQNIYESRGICDTASDAEKSLLIKLKPYQKALL
jgi:hypothetical protein